MNTAKYLELPSDLQDRIYAYYEFVRSASHPGPSGMAELAKLPKKVCGSACIISRCVLGG